MNCHGSNDLSATQAVEHIRYRLSGSKSHSINFRVGATSGIDRILGHMRDRLRTASQQQPGPPKEIADDDYFKCQWNGSSTFCGS